MSIHIPPPDERAALADRIRGHKRIVAEGVTDEFFERHPDWLTRFGSAGRIRGVEDAGFHLEFLAGAVESGSVEAYRDYVRWTVQVLRTRGIESHFVAENLGQIGRCLVGILDPAEANLVSAFVAAGREASAVAASEPTGGEATAGLSLTRRLFVQALLQGHRKAATNIALEAFRCGHPVPDIYAEVIQEALYEVGRLWQANRITVAEEHMATAIAQFVLAQLYPHLPLPEAARGAAVVTGVEGELHQVGANMVADVLEADGWDVQFLGTNVPDAGILKVIEEHDADVVGISATMLFNVPKVRRLIADARARFPSRRLRIFVGGGAFRNAPNLPGEIGADGFAADLRSAVALVRG